MSSKLAVQMYTLREFTKTRATFVETLKKVRRLGYEAVQLSAVGCMHGDTPEVTAAEARELLDAHGLKTVATHRSWDALTTGTDAEIAFHRVLGCRYAAIGGIPGDYRLDGADGYRRFVDDARPVLAALKAAGITWGYHNHAHEFQRLPDGRGTWYDIFVEHGGIDFTLELDTYWAMHAGVNPVRIFERCHGRVPVVHFKDMEVTSDGPVFAPCGEGNLDWDAIIPAAEAAGVQWYAIEQDVCRRDPFDCLRASFDFLTAKGL